MENKMFCFQCEQTAGCSGCTGKVGVCGKNADVAALQDKLTGELIGLVRVTGDVVPTGNILKLIIEGLFTTLTNVSFNEQTLNELIEKVRAERSSHEKTSYNTLLCGTGRRLSDDAPG
mgnify:CR=1 FL=1